MRLTHPKAIRQFAEHGVLATLRTWPYREGQMVVVNMPKGKKRARVVKVIERPSFRDVREHASISGFDTADEWYSAALRLHKRRPRYLVVIEEVIDRDWGWGV